MRPPFRADQVGSLLRPERLKRSREESLGPQTPTELRGDVLDLLSLIFWSLMVVVTIKYLIFIMHADSPHLDNQYTAFGKVTSGLEVVDKIATQPTGGNDRPRNPAHINSIRIEEK